MSFVDGVDQPQSFQSFLDQLLGRGLPGSASRPGSVSAPSVASAADPVAALAGGGGGPAVAASAPAISAGPAQPAAPVAASAPAPDSSAPLATIGPVLGGVDYGPGGPPAASTSPAPSSGPAADAPFRTQTLGRNDPPAPAADPAFGTRTLGRNDPPAGPPMGADPASILGGLGINIDPSQFAAIPNMADLPLALQSKSGNNFLFKDQAGVNDFLNTNAAQQQSTDINAAMAPAEAAMNAQRLKGESFFGGLAKGLPLIAAVLSMNPAIGGALASALGLGGGIGGLSAGTLGTGILNAGAGAVAGGERGGLEGALLGALGGGGGALAGGALGNLLGGLGGGAGGAAGGAGAAAGGAGATAGSLGDLAGSVSPLVINGASPLSSILSSIGSSAGGGLGGVTPRFNPGPNNNSGFSDPGLAGGTTITAPDANPLLRPPTMTGEWPGGVIGGSVGAGSPNNQPGTEVSSLTVTAPGGSGPVDPLAALGNIPGLVDTPKALADDASKIDQNNNPSLKPVQDLLNKIIGDIGPGSPGLGFPSLPNPDIFGGGPGPGAGPSITTPATPATPPPAAPDPFTPPPATPGGGGPGPGIGGPGSPSGIPGSFDFSTPSLTKPGAQTTGGVGSGGAGPAGLGSLNVKGSAAPDIYPWSPVV